jgi:5-methyltetrahydropteroyltriglutamate--homocysteine methyltransferase
MIRHMNYQDLPDEAFLKIAARNVAALNHATDGLPRDRMRMHICWGNYPGPHTHDLPVAKIIPILMQANPAAILFEGANPAHAHEWEDWKAAKLNDDTVLVPGVIDTTTNLVETPRLIAQRLKSFADIVGKDRVIASTDCGFGTVAGREVVARSVVWKKLSNLVEGAALASKN